MQIDVRRFSGRAELDAALADRLEQAIRAAAAAPRGGPPVIMLSGGHTPLAAFREVARRRPPQGGPLTVIYSDDRYVPADSESSNYHATRPLLDALRLPDSQVLRVRTELSLEEAARDYDRRLRALLDGGARIGVALLGLGADGHTASLFDAEQLQNSRGHLAVAVQRPDGMQGISVTPDFLANVAEPLFVVAGSGKHDAIAAFIREDLDLIALRAVAGHPRVELWLERASELASSGK
ncbi:MAG TPA: 6-phosphogluconolactonase [Steroidobacteraceae bacterium]|nr:6-phosphogluconolactonase [Steroidobacteraceae bacterium]